LRNQRYVKKTAWQLKTWRKAKIIISLKTHRRRRRLGGGERNGEAAASA